MSVATGMTIDEAPITQPQRSLRRNLRQDLDTPVKLFTTKDGEQFKFCDFLKESGMLVIKNVANEKKLYVGKHGQFFYFFAFCFSPKTFFTKQILLIKMKQKQKKIL